MIQTKPRRLLASSRIALAARGHATENPAVMYLPYLGRQEYQAIYQISGGTLPHSFATWLHMRRERGLLASATGSEVIDVQVRLHEFSCYCETTQQMPTVSALYEFATLAGSAAAAIASEMTIPMPPRLALVSGFSAVIN
jgi:hypothetical protein